jgi:hypothetical protein
MLLIVPPSVTEYGVRLEGELEVVTVGGAAGVVMVATQPAAVLELSDFHAMVIFPEVAV